MAATALLTGPAFAVSPAGAATTPVPTVTTTSPSSAPTTPSRTTSPTPLVSVTAPAVSRTAPRTTAPSATKSPRATGPTLPVPRSTVRPELAVGGPRLASMGVVTDLPAGVPAPPAIKNVAWLLADADTGQVIAAKAPHARLLPASTMKVLTALTLMPSVAPDSTLVATQADAGADGTRVGLVPGLSYTGRQLFQALLMSSGNDAAYALAASGKGREANIAAMNAKAAYLGAHDTVVGDPSGLDAPGQTSSAYDLALIGRAALQVKDFREYVTTRQVDFPGGVDRKTKKRTSFKIDNHNKLLYNYPGTIGIKNGYTIAARRTFISAVTRGDKTYILSEMYSLETGWRAQAAMYDWAFAYGSLARPVGELVEPGALTTPPKAPPTTEGPAPSVPGVQTSTARPPTAAAAALPATGRAFRSFAPGGTMGYVLAGVLLLSGLGLLLRSRSRRDGSGRHR